MRGRRERGLGVRGESAGGINGVLGVSGGGACALVEGWGVATSCV